MKTYTFTTELWLPRPRAEVFAFFGEARNLEVITPSWLRFEVLTPAPFAMRAGTLIDYRIQIHGIPVRWRTEIMDWNPPHQFVDVQRRGPYSLWHHKHTFAEHNGGTNCADRVQYRPHGGALMNWLFVRRDVERIFDYRRKRLLEMFDAPAAAPASDQPGRS